MVYGLVAEMMKLAVRAEVVSDQFHSAWWSQRRTDDGSYPVWRGSYHLVDGLNPSEKYESQLGWLETQYMGK